MRVMMKVSMVTALSLSTALAPSLAIAGDGTDAAQFHELLRSAVPSKLASDKAMKFVHLLPDQDVIDASNAASIEQALESIKKSSLPKLTEHTEKMQKDLQKQVGALEADKILESRPITMVIVPGIFGEFIPTRGFEDVLSQPSQDRTTFKGLVGAAHAANDPNAIDLSFDLYKQKEIVKPLSDLIHVGNISNKAGKPIARVVLLFTPEMSLESMGGLEDHAAMFNRRLSKYMAITGSQDLALIGYSRGTVLGLEMLAQAKTQNLPWLSNVKGMISLGGVSWGSTLADDTEDESSANKKAIESVRKLRKSLDPGSFIQTGKAWLAFADEMRKQLPAMQNHKLTPKDAQYKISLSTQIDITSMLGLVGSVAGKLGLQRPATDFGNNVLRFQTFLDSVLAGVGTLTSSARTEWWKTHTLPTSVRYYSITGAMANPEAGEIDNKAYTTAIGYNNNFDDKSLLQNRLDYEAISGITLNDSQVSVAQVMILPNAAAALNPANTGIQESFLGTVGTHHWGLALRIVNSMKDGQVNPFPREALLKALAAKVALDQGK